MTTKISSKQLKIRQAYSLDIKISLSNLRIRQWYEHFCGSVYVSFSGGKDSTVLLDLVRRQYPEVPAVFIDTGLEFPEIRDFVKSIDNVVWIKPKMNFKQVIEKYGYPVISKKISMGVDRYCNTKFEVQKKLRLYGGINPTSGKKQHPTISKKWHYLIAAPFKISDRCCDVLKKSPIKKYNRESGRAGIIGTMATDSTLRKQVYYSNGCNAFDRVSGPLSTPMAFWKEADVWEYIKEYSLPYSTIYDKGYDRTGCIFCAFGCHMEKNNRFIQLQKTHPKLYHYCIEELHMGEVLEYIGILYK